MARVIPDGWRQVEALGAAQREIETLARLEAGLADDYVVYHSVHWTRVEQGASLYGEIDFVVVNRAGDLLCIEQKSGFLEETKDGLVKRYPGKTKSVAIQLSRSLHALQQQLGRALKGPPVRIEYLLYCPDYHVRNPHAAGIASERIVDAARRHELVTRIGAALSAGEEGPAAKEVHRFLRDILQLEPDAGALIGRARESVTRIAGGLARWARQLSFTPYRLRVEGTAGSGKTQLALAEYRDALERGERPLYVCFNRPLADHFAGIAPDGGLACTFHMLCERVVRGAGGVPDLSQAGAFDALVRQACASAPQDDLLFDTLIVDEGQDFEPDWRELVLRHVRQDGRVLWLEDPCQNLYARPGMSWDGWVTLWAHSNYRSPRPIARFVQALLPRARIEAASPFDTAAVDFLIYDSHAELLQRVKDAIRQCLAAGFRKEEIVIVSFRGREASALLGYDRIGPHGLRAFSGKYDLLGQAVYSEGDVLVESVYRFKGQTAPAVILAEVDFAALDERAARKLFVGATRALMKLVMIVTSAAARELNARLEDPARETGGGASPRPLGR